MKPVTYLALFACSTMLWFTYAFLALMYDGSIWQLLMGIVPTIHYVQVLSDLEKKDNEIYFHPFPFRKTAPVLVK